MSVRALGVDFVAPCGVPAMGGHGDGSFAAYGRDAGLKTGAPVPRGTERDARGWRDVSKSVSGDT